MWIIQHSTKYQTKHVFYKLAIMFQNEYFFGFCCLLSINVLWLGDERWKEVGPITMNLHHTILFVHCGETVVQSFFDEILRRLSHLFSRFSVVALNCVTGEVERVPLSRPMPRELKKYIRMFDVSIERYDRELATLNELEKVCIPMTVLTFILFEL